MLAGEIVVGEHVRRACERHRDDLKHGKSRGLHFDKVDALFAIECFRYCRHWEGDHAGEAFELSPWQAFIVWSLFGWKRANGKRRFRRAYIEVARGNGKSTFLAAMAIILLALDGEQGAQVWSAATTKDQAAIVFNSTVKMVEASPELKEFIKFYKATKRLVVPETNSIFGPLSADENTGDGLNVYAAIIDELHAHRTRGMWDVLDTATGKRSQALMLAITTAGTNQDGICYEIRGLCIDILKRIVEDDAFFAFVAAIDDTDDWQDESCWIKANPNQGISVDLDDLREKAARARRSAGSRNNFLIKHCCRWAQAVESWIPIEKWDGCLLKAADRYTEDDLKGRRCFGGLDVSQKIDLEAFVLAFPPDADCTKWRFIYRFFMPEATIQQREDEGDLRYRTWQEAGHIILAGEDDIDPDIVRAEINTLRDEFTIEQIGYDPWNAYELAKHLEQDGIVCVKVPQTTQYLNEPSREFEAMVTSHRLEHNGNPVMRSNVDNVAIKSDSNGLIKPVKPRDRRKKIDGVAALLNGLTCAIRVEQPQQGFKPAVW